MPYWPLVFVSFGLCVMAGTVAIAVPSLGWLGPLLGYLAGMSMALGFRLVLPKRKKEPDCPEGQPGCKVI